MTSTASPTPEIPGFVAVIPAGGVGSRLWPLSRPDRPKFLLDLLGEGRTLLQATLDRLRPNKEIPLKAQQADGVNNCRQLLKDLSEGNVRANFIEGMGCVGGCVGGPKSLIDRALARDAVNLYGDGAVSKTPADNPFVLDLLHRLGYLTVESLLDRDNNFTRTL